MEENLSACTILIILLNGGGTQALLEKNSIVCIIAYLNWYFFNSNWNIYC